jgi:hypothetical protein
MVSEKTSTRLVVPLVLSVATAVYAVPTVSEHEQHLTVCPAFAKSYFATPSTYDDEINLIGEGCNSGLTSIAAEFLKPPAAFAQSQAPPIHASSLPPIPGTLSMALMGLLCVSLVKDRKVWMAVLASILSTGQTGFRALPQLASHLCSKNQIEQQLNVNIAYVCWLRDSARPRTDIDGTRYIGLLHRLAGIPATPNEGIASCVMRDASPRIQWWHSYIRQPIQETIRNTQYDIRNTNRSPQFAITVPYLTSFRERAACSSPAFTFGILARGPPNPA